MTHNPNCALCRNNNPFNIPPDLYDALKKSRLVIFAGAGISTESEQVFPYTLYDELLEDLDDSVKSKGLDFPNLVTLFEKQDNGRKKLLTKIRARIQYTESFPSLFNAATSFHRELADMHQIKEIITTNWDDFFEIVCGAVPFIVPEDFAFWELPDRKVLKIHGSINNLSTIVASSSDYNKCRESLIAGTIGSFLRVLLATKTVVFCGYSFSDPDFKLIQRILKEDMKEYMPHAYIVTIDQSITDKLDITKITPIFTDATFFLHSLKGKLISDGIMNDPVVYLKCMKQLEDLHYVHAKVLHKYDLSINPVIIYTYSFQDGLSDALERGLKNSRSGLYLCPTYIENHIRKYDQLSKEKEKLGKYWDMAYIEGYIQGLLFFIAPSALQSSLPFYYLPGYDHAISDRKDFNRLLKKSESYNSKAYKEAIQIYKKKLKDKDMILEHTPIL